MFKYLGCLLILFSAFLVGKYISECAGKRIEGIKYNLDKLKRTAMDYEFFNININFSAEKYDYMQSRDFKLFETANKIKSIDELNELITEIEEYYKNVNQKNEWLKRNGIVLSILTGIALITLLY